MRDLKLVLVLTAATLLAAASWTVGCASGPRSSLSTATPAAPPTPAAPATPAAPDPPQALAAPAAPAVPRCVPVAPIKLAPPEQLPRVSGSVSLDVSTWASHELDGIELQAPPWLVAQAIPGGARLWSEVVVDDPHGVVEPGEETRHWLRIEVRVHPGPLQELVCRTAPEHLEGLFPLEATEPAASDFAQRTVAGVQAMELQVGSHGYDERHVFVPLSPDHSASLSFYTVGEYLWPALPPRHAKVAAQQDAIVRGVLDSVRLATP